MWHAIYKKLWVIILIPVLAAGVAYLVTAKKAGQYKSTAVIEASIPDPSPKSKTLKDIQQPDEYYKNMVETMKTEIITSMASYRLLLHDLETEIAFRPPAIQYSAERKAVIRRTLEKKLSSFQLLSETVPAESTIGQVIHNMDYNVARWIRDGEVTIKRRATSAEVDVATVTEDPFLSAFAANSLAQEYIRYERSITGLQPTTDSVGYYRQEVDRLRRNLEAKNSELTEASAQLSAPANTDNVRFDRAKADRISEYEMRVKEEEWEIRTLRDQLAKLQRDAQPEPELPQQSPKDVATSSKIQAIRNKIDQLSGIYAQGGSKDKQLDSIINVLRKQLNEATTRLQMSSQPTVSKQPASNPERDMLESRIQRHEENADAIRRDIRRLKNTTNRPVANNNNNKANIIAQLKSEQEQASKEYNVALAHLQALEAKSGNSAGTQSRESHHLILKEKALPSAEPESPHAMLIVLSVYLGVLLLCIIIIVANKPAPTPYDDIFLRVNYANRRSNKKSTPVTQDGSF
jgi:succinoglycan biosynthesis transport protein ExoP